MFCTKCGKELINPGRFCTGCGAPLDAPAPAQQPVQQPMQQPVPQAAPTGTLYEGVATWNQGGIMYSSCFLVITAHMVSIYKHKRAYEKNQTIATIPTVMLQNVSMSGNMNGPYITVKLTDGKTINFRYLFRMDEIHRALYMAGKSKNPQWFQQ